MIIKELTDFLESRAPKALQEGYDNAGLITGNAADKITGVLISLDITEAVIEEAIEKGSNLIVAHHPIIFKAIKRLTGDDYVQRCIIKAVKNNVALYAAHTNMDNVTGGVNSKIARLVGLKNTEILSPQKGRLRKLVTFVPGEQLEDVREALFAAGAGHIGNYDKCSYNLEGNGTFRAGENTNPFAGKKGEFHTEPEVRTETVYPDYYEGSVIRALHNAHPYEEPAYDIYSLENEHKQIGAGIIGDLPYEEPALDFLLKIKKIFAAGCIKHTKLNGQTVKKIAICGGAGSFLLPTAKASKADMFISADFKYHEFFDADDDIIIADIGHYESEQFTKNLFYELITKNFSNFACSISAINTNPINYL
jgi:dinuclear metal center YbgI/SA1388 family protein